MRARDRVRRRAGGTDVETYSEGYDADQRLDRAPQVTIPIHRP